MIEILGEDSYRGFSASISELGDHARPGIQPIYVGRLIWPGESVPSDVVIKLYEPATCGVANEAIGYMANAVRDVQQPKRSAILILSKDALPSFQYNIEKYIDQATGFAACWVTSLEQNAKPFSYLRRLSTFSEKQATAFYKSKFSQVLAGVDHVTGNNDRHDGNFLYIDDLKYLAIDQGNIGGSPFWHTIWPDDSARNELLLQVQKNLSNSQFAAWQANAILEYEKTRSSWNLVSDEIGQTLRNLLTDEQISTIVTFMSGRADSNQFTESCGNLL